MPGFILQIKSFGISMSIGVFGGWLYDLYRVSFQLLKWRSRFLTAIGDASFWLVFIAAACFFLFVGNAGEVRFYTFLGMAAGLLIYRRFFHRRMVSFESRCGAALLRSMNAIGNSLLFSFRPLRHLAGLFRRRRNH
ncbi:MAG: spore cortex biosynthesis protein YabQ [Bacillota bacterium]